MYVDLFSVSVVSHCIHTQAMLASLFAVTVCQNHATSPRQTTTVTSGAWPQHRHLAYTAGSRKCNTTTLLKLQGFHMLLTYIKVFITSTEMPHVKAVVILTKIAPVLTWKK